MVQPDKSDLQKYLGSYFGIMQDNLQKVADLFQEEYLSKGEYLLRKDQFCDKLSFVQSGFIRIYAHHENKEITQWISTAGYFLTDLYSFIFDQRARWNIQALTDSTLYTIRKRDYRELKSIVPNWHEMENKFISGCFIILEDRVFSHLSLSAEERYEKLLSENKELLQNVPMQYLASMLGMTPETFSRVRRKTIS
ncbi:MAG: Crp/Fnr family transcriptional regulator [Bacteroidota bacterium]